MVIIIYTKEEVKNSNIVDTVVKVVEKECVCPEIKNDACLNTNNKEENAETSTGTSFNEEMLGELMAKELLKNSVVQVPMAKLWKEFRIFISQNT